MIFVDFWSSHLLLGRSRPRSTRKWFSRTVLQFVPFKFFYNFNSFYITSSSLLLEVSEIDQSDYRKITTHFKKVGCGPISSSLKKKWVTRSTKFKYWSQTFSRKQNVSPVNIFLFETLHLTPRRHICVTQAVNYWVSHLPAISSL